LYHNIELLDSCYSWLHRPLRKHYTRLLERKPGKSVPNSRTEQATFLRVLSLVYIPAK